MQLYMESQTKLSLACKPGIGSLVAEETERIEEIVARLQQEKLKLNAFKRELPLCMQLITNAMEALRQELQSQRMKAGEYFISVKNSTSSTSSSLSSDKAEWMASATLWNQDLKEEGAEVGVALEASRREESNGQKGKRKARRCWSPHLHRRFVNALHMLGGSQMATPKRITELMEVDGLTHDEVKSHLQKYRLHTRIQTPSPLLVVGGIWVPPDYAAAAAAATPTRAPPSHIIRL